MANITSNESKNALLDVASDSAEQRLAKYGFFVNEDIQGTSEADELANTLAGIIESVQEQQSKVQ
jgi:hypothetical protein